MNFLPALHADGKLDSELSDVLPHCGKDSATRHREPNHLTRWKVMYSSVGYQRSLDKSNHEKMR